MKKIIVIVGPTAVGKSKLSIDLASEIPAEIISGDSMQVYKGLDIGTGKVTKAEQKGIPHYMLDIKAANESFSVAEFQQKVQQYIRSIHQKKKLPILVGGTGLYIQAVLYDYSFSERKRDEQTTKRLEKRLQTEGNEVLYKELMKIDPSSARAIHPNNTKRLIRALEIYETTGLTMSETHKNQEQNFLYDPFVIGLEMERELLYEQINHRVDQMVDDGLIDEAAKLYRAGLEHTQAMKAIGYKEFIPFFKGEILEEEAIELLKRNSRRYAKRQYTWFKNRMNVHWYQIEQTSYPTLLQQIRDDCNQFLRRP